MFLRRYRSSSLVALLVLVSHGVGPEAAEAAFAPPPADSSASAPAFVAPPEPVVAVLDTTPVVPPASLPVVVGTVPDTVVAPTVPQVPRARSIENIAVSDLVGKGVPQPEADLITEEVRAALVTSGGIKVMERSMMDQILKEQGFQESGACDNSECMVQVGRMLGVQRLAVGSVGKVGKIFMINMKLVDVSTGEVTHSLTETCECPVEDVLRQTTRKIASGIEYEIRRTKAGTLLVASDPPGAKVFLQDREVGATPWTSALLDPGPYRISLTLQDWKRLDRLVEISTGKQSALNLTLERSEEWLAARKAAEEAAIRAEQQRKEDLQRQAEASRAQRKLFWRIGLSALSALCVGGGYYFQTQVDADEKASADAYARYRSASSQEVLDEARNATQDYDKRAAKDRTMRNIGFGLGAAAAASIGFTWLF